MARRFGTLLVWSVFFLLSATAHSENSQFASPNESEDIVISATRVQTPSREIGSSVSVIPAKEIERRGASDVLDALKGIPGLDVVQSGGSGGNAAVFLRGANADHTLVMIDNVLVNDPINPNRSFDFKNLTTDNIERIEVLRGPQSTLYGSDALGGVINIITKKGRGAPSAFASFEGGSFDTYIERGGVSGGTDKVNYSFAASRKDIHGFSAADEKFGNKEADPYQNTSLSSRIGVTPSKDLALNFFARYSDSKTALDNEGGIGGDDPNRFLFNQDLFLRAEGSYESIKNSLTHLLGVSYTVQNFQDNNDVDPAHPVDLLRSKYFGRMLQFDFKNTLKVNDNVSFLGGVDVRREMGSSVYHSESSFGPFDDDFAGRSATTAGYYFQTMLTAFDALYTTIGARVDDRSDFGTRVTYRIAPAYNIDSTGTKISGSVGTGFKAPTLNERYSSLGNLNLQPEKSIGVDGGIEQSLFHKKVKIGATYFWNRFDDLISFDPNNFVFENISKARTQGLETYVRADLANDLNVGADVTYTDAKDEVEKASLLRRPRIKVGTQVNYRFLGKGNAHGEVLFTGKKFDNDCSTFPATRVALSGYGITNLKVSYEVTENVQVFARIDNVFDRNYEDVFGFGTAGIAAYGGVKVSL